MAETFQVRDFFNPKVVTAMGERFKKVKATFDKAGFIAFINPKLAALTYSERLQLITEGQEKFLPQSFPTAAKLIVDSLLPPYGSDELDETNNRFIVATKAAYIAKNGLDHFDISMNALYEITKRMSSEWGVRPFFIKYPEQTLAVFKKWASDENPHVRRLVSEGSRPSLPWGKKLPQFEKDPKPTLALLELLKNDPSEYVRRSVANHLNDHTKKHPDLVVETLKRWQSESINKDKMRMIKHALRTLLKKGHAGALDILGYKKGAKVAVQQLVADEKVKVGDYLNFSFNLQSTGKTKQPLMIDYVIYYQKANGELAPKVFKMTTKELGAEASLLLKKRQSFKVITTRKFHLGAHQLAIQVNGEELAKVDFELVEH
ncbi:MAG: DNA alkylation repair protein [Saprospiraceae bacterium]